MSTSLHLSCGIGIGNIYGRSGNATDLNTPPVALRFHIHGCVTMGDKVGTNTGRNRLPSYPSGHEIAISRYPDRPVPFRFHVAVADSDSSITVTIYTSYQSSGTDVIYA